MHHVIGKESFGPSDEHNHMNPQQRSHQITMEHTTDSRQFDKAAISPTYYPFTQRWEWLQTKIDKTSSGSDKEQEESDWSDAQSAVDIGPTSKEQSLVDNTQSHEDQNPWWLNEREKLFVREMPHIIRQRMC